MDVGQLIKRARWLGETRRTPAAAVVEKAAKVSKGEPRYTLPEACVAITKAAKIIAERDAAKKASIAEIVDERIAVALAKQAEAKS